MRKHMRKHSEKWPGQFQKDEIKHDVMARTAYELWEEAGREDGKDMDHWREVDRLFRSHQ